MTMQTGQYAISVLPEDTALPTTNLAQPQVMTDDRPDPETQHLPAVQLYYLLKTLNSSQLTTFAETALRDQAVQQDPITTLRHLQSLLPSRELHQFETCPQVRGPAFLQLLLYGATNNFDEVEYSLPFLSVDSCLISLVRFASQQQFSDNILLRPLAESLFRSALRTGNSDAVAFLLNGGQCVAGTDINYHVCVHNGKRLTPVELSAGLGHLPLTKVLISHGADLNKTLALDVFSLDHPRGALEWALHHERTVHHERALVNICPGVIEQGQHSGDDSASNEDQPPTLLEDILEAGGKLVSYDIDGVPYDALEALERVRDLAALDSLLRTFLYSDEAVAVWSRKGLFHLAFLRLDSQKLGCLLKHMEKVDLNATCDRPELAALIEGEHDRCQAGVRFRQLMIRRFGGRSAFAYIDIAARRGMEPLVRALQHKGARLTPSFWPAAIRSGNEALINFLYLSLDYENAHQFSPVFYTTAYSEALRSDNSQLVAACEQHGWFETIRDEAQQVATLAAAANVGDTALVRRLLDLTCLVDINLLAPALVEAVAASHIHICEALLTAGAPLVQFGRDWQYEQCHPMMIALRNRKSALVKLLLDHGLEWTHNGEELEEAVRWADKSVIDLLVAAGAPQGNSLAVAIECGSFWGFHKILPVSTYEKLSGALEMAVTTQKPTMTAQLLRAGADAANGRALSHAICHSPEIAQLLLERFATVYPQGKPGFGADVLAQAVSSGRMGDLATLLKLGIGVRTRLERPGFRNHANPLAKSIEGGDIAITSMLLECDPDIDIIVRTQTSSLKAGLFPTNETPLLVAIAEGNTEMVAFLIDKGANVNLPLAGLLKRTPLQHAAGCGSIEIIKLLLSKGADVNAPAAKREGATALQAAARSGFIGIAEILLAHGADLSAPGSELWGRTALQTAAWRGRIDMVRYLLHYGPHPVADCYNSVALARRRGHMAVVEALESTIRRCATGHIVTPPARSGAGEGHAGFPNSPKTASGSQDTGQGTSVSSSNLPTLQSFQLPLPPTNQINDQTSPAQQQDDDCAMADSPSNRLSSSPSVSTSSTKKHCRTCNKTFINASTLRRHQRHACSSDSESAKPAMQCPVCDKRFARRDIYMRHRATHDEEKKRQVICERCGGGFSRKDYMKVHLRRCKGTLNELEEERSGSETAE